MSDQPVIYDRVLVTAVVHLAPGIEAQMVADWLMSLTEHDLPEGVGPIDWKFEVPR